MVNTSVVRIVVILSQVGHSGSSKNRVFYFHAFHTAITHFLYPSLSFNDTIPMRLIEIIQYSASFLNIYFCNGYFLIYTLSNRGFSGF